MNFFQIGALELERQRRQSERVTALQKLADVDCRLTEIAAEIEGLLRDAEVDLAPRQSLAGESSPSKQGFNLKY